MPNSPFLAPERDPAFKRGRFKKSGTTYYTLPGVALSGIAASGTRIANTDYYAPFFCDTPLVIDQLVSEVVTVDSGKAFRIGIYPADLDWQPAAGAAPLADSGDLSLTTAAVVTYTPGSPIYLPRGRYLTVLNMNSNFIGVLRCLIGQPSHSFLDTTIGSTAYSRDFRVARTYAAFPTPGTPWNTTGNNAATPGMHCVVVRVSQP
jgi:hypothetical protein